MRHPRPRLSEHSRLVIANYAERGIPQARIAELMQVSRPTVAKWVRRYRSQGLAGLADRSSRPHVVRRTPPDVEVLVVEARRRLRSGPDDLAPQLGLARTTVWRILRRHGCSRLADFDRTHTIAVRYERERPGELIHIDVKKLGRVPDGGGWRLLGRGHRVGSGHLRNPGRDYVHVAVDDCTRLAFVEVYPDDKGDSCARFLGNATRFFAEHGVTVERVLTDRALNYRRGTFVTTAAELGVLLRKTRPYRPQTNGKAERFIRTLVGRWAYAELYTSNQQRLNALPGWVDFYNRRRPHRALKGLTPSAALANKVMEDYS